MCLIIIIIFIIVKPDGSHVGGVGIYVKNDYRYSVTILDQYKICSNSKNIVDNLWLDVSIVTQTGILLQGSIDILTSISLILKNNIEPILSKIHDRGIHVL